MYNLMNTNFSDTGITGVQMSLIIYVCICNRVERLDKNLRKNKI